MLATQPASCRPRAAIASPSAGAWLIQPRRMPTTRITSRPRSARSSALVAPSGPAARKSHPSTMTTSACCRPQRRPPGSAKVDDHARFGRRDVQKQAGRNSRVDQRARQIDAGRRPDVLHIVQAGGIGAGSDRLPFRREAVAPARWSRAQVMKVLPISVSVPVRKSVISSAERACRMSSGHRRSGRPSAALRNFVGRLGAQEGGSAHQSVRRPSPTWLAPTAFDRAQQGLEIGIAPSASCACTLTADRPAATAIPSDFVGLWKARVWR